MVTVEITIPILSQWPTREQLGARNAVESALNAAGLGIVSGVGGGMGVMDVAYRVDDETKVAAAHAVIDKAMQTHMPQFRYQVTIR
jgi:hypothetical protein